MRERGADWCQRTPLGWKSVEAKLGCFKLTEDGGSQDRGQNWGGAVGRGGRTEESKEGPT